jgi:hypothetical protein
MTDRSEAEIRNESRRDQGLARAYGEEAFAELAQEMYRVSLDLATKI